MANAICRELYPQLTIRAMRGQFRPVQGARVRKRQMSIARPSPCPKTHHLRELEFAAPASSPRSRVGVYVRRTGAGTEYRRTACGRGSASASCTAIATGRARDRGLHGEVAQHGQVFPTIDVSGPGMRYFRTFSLSTRHEPHGMRLRVWGHCRRTAGCGGSV
jgi:hypothetical protein